MCDERIIETYTIAVKKEFKEKSNKTIRKNVTEIYGDEPLDVQDIDRSSEEDINLELKNEVENLKQTTVQNVSLKILDPAIPLTWMYMCDNWRKKTDFNFDRAADWTDDCKVLRFNDTWYVQNHHLLDWHDFLLLKNGTLLCPFLMVCDEEAENKHTLMYIISIDYNMPNRLKYITKVSQFAGLVEQKQWKPTYWVTFKTLRAVANNLWSLSVNPQLRQMNLNEKWVVVEESVYQGKVAVARNNARGGRMQTYVDLKTPKYKHIDVAANKPFFMTIMGTDKYHHTQFTGKHNMDTHGVYWWPANYDSRMQFNRCNTMVMTQAPAIIPLTVVGKHVYKHWELLMREGVILWHEGQLQKAYGMVSHQITDMQDRRVFQRRRGANKHGRSEGMLWAGWEAGAAWPEDVDDLLEAGCVAPGPYLHKVWHFLFKTCVNKDLWVKPPVDLAQDISLTNADVDVYNDLAIASTLKSTIEINHTTILGCLVKALAIEWTSLHRLQHFALTHTRQILNAILESQYAGVNGMRPTLLKYSTDILTFNQMHHGWAKMIELVFALPRTVNWYGNIGLLVSLVRITVGLYLCQTENERKRLRRIVKPILQQS